MKLNNSDCYDSIMVTLAPDKYPTAFANKVDELIEQNQFKTREEAEAYVSGLPLSWNCITRKGPDCLLWKRKPSNPEQSTPLIPRNCWKMQIAIVKSLTLTIKKQDL